jgi:hypothetical protein
LPERWQALVFVNGWLGLRWSESLGLPRMDVNPLRKELHVGRVTVVEPDCRTLLIKEGGKSRQRMLDASVDLLDVSKRLGHSCPSTTYDIYAHLLDRRREAGTTALEVAMRKAAERGALAVGNVGHFEMDALIALNAASVPPIYGLTAYRTRGIRSGRLRCPTGDRVPLI